MGETTDSAEISDPVQRSAETTREEGRMDTTTHPIVNFRYLVAVNTTQSIHICRTAVSTFLLGTAHSHGISSVLTRICCLSDVSVIEMGCTKYLLRYVYTMVKSDTGSAKLINYC